ILRGAEEAPPVAAERRLPAGDLRGFQIARFLERAEIERLRVLGAQQRQQDQPGDLLHHHSRTKTRMTFPPFHPWRNSADFPVTASRTISLGPDPYAPRFLRDSTRPTTPSPATFRLR